MATETVSRLPSEKRKQIKPRELVIFEVDYALRELKPEDRPKLLDAIKRIARDREVVIYTDDRKRMEQEVAPYDLRGNVMQAPLSFEKYGSRHQFSKQFFDPALRGRDPTKASFYGMNIRYVWRSYETGMLTTYMNLKGEKHVPGSTHYVISEISQIESKFRGRKF